MLIEIMIRCYIVAVRLCEKDDTWKPLLLIVPLRLGLSEVNPIYINCIKKSFEIPGTVGMVGGRPNQALYFIGYVGEEALYLDPHTTQKSGSIGDKATPLEIEMDETYHQKYAARINFKNMDPSLALVCCVVHSFYSIFVSSLLFVSSFLCLQCFLCRTKTEFNELCTRLQNDLLRTGTQPLFEITRTSQTPWRSRPDRPATQTDGDQSEDDFEFIV